MRVHRTLRGKWERSKNLRQVCYKTAEFLVKTMPTLVLLAGPNGAGKTTFINRFLRQRAEAFRFVNPDEASLSRWERA
ncbi:ABC-type Mn2+/Zn2+ transport system ATPase subunit [Brevundimonas vesicularis]|nr:ABC-type Mn2+/Zn2+ transport system ATPase subunit [Brevundimonas vesicularis]